MTSRDSSRVTPRDRLWWISVDTNMSNREVSAVNEQEYHSQKNLKVGAASIENIHIVSNNNNFTKGSGSTLLSFDGGVMLFHGMG